MESKPFLVTDGHKTVVPPSSQTKVWPLTKIGLSGCLKNQLVKLKYEVSGWDHEELDFVWIGGGALAFWPYLGMRLSWAVTLQNGKNLTLMCKI